MNTKSLLDRCRTISTKCSETGSKMDSPAVRNTFQNHARTMDRLTRTTTDNASTIGIKNNQNFNKSMSKLLVKLVIDNSCKKIMKGSKMEPKGSQTSTKMEPKGCQMANKVAHQPIQNDPGTSNWTSPAKL